MAALDLLVLMVMLPDGEKKSKTIKLSEVNWSDNDKKS